MEKFDLIEVQNIEKIDTGSLLAKCDVYIKPWHLILKEVKIFEKGEQRWIGLPARETMGADGVKRYVELVEFDSEQVKKRFRSSIMGAVNDFIKSNPSLEPKPLINANEEMPF